MRKTTNVKVVSVHHEPYAESFWKIRIPIFDLEINCVDTSFETSASHTNLVGEEISCNLGIYCASAKIIEAPHSFEFQLVRTISEVSESAVTAIGKVIELEDNSHLIIDVGFPLSVQTEHDLNTSIGEWIEVFGLTTIEFLSIGPRPISKSKL